LGEGGGEVGDLKKGIRKRKAIEKRRRRYDETKLAVKTVKYCICEKGKQ
jgi:hypothetical protein